MTTLAECLTSADQSLGGRDRHAAFVANASERDALLLEQSEELLFLRHHDDALLDAPSEDDLRSLSADGFVGAAASALQAADSEADRDALRLMYRLIGEAA